MSCTIMVVCLASLPSQMSSIQEQKCSLVALNCPTTCENSHTLAYQKWALLLSEMKAYTKLTDHLTDH